MEEKMCIGMILGKELPKITSPCEKNKPKQSDCNIKNPKTHIVSIITELL